MIVERAALIQAIREAQAISVEPEYSADYVLSQAKKITVAREIRSDILENALSRARLIADLGKEVYRGLAVSRLSAHSEIVTVIYIGGKG